MLVNNRHTIAQRHAFPRAPVGVQVEHVGFVRDCRLLYGVEIVLRLLQKLSGVLALLVDVRINGRQDSAASVRMAPNLGGFCILYIVLAAVDVAERQAATVAACVGFNTLAVAVNTCLWVNTADGALYVNDVLSPREAFRAALVAARSPHADVAMRDLNAIGLDARLKLAAPCRDEVGQRRPYARMVERMRCAGLEVACSDFPARAAQDGRERFGHAAARPLIFYIVIEQLGDGVYADGFAVGLAAFVAALLGVVAAVVKMLVRIALTVYPNDTLTLGKLAAACDLKLIGSVERFGVCCGSVSQAPHVLAPAVEQGKADARD